MVVLLQGKKEKGMVTITILDKEGYTLNLIRTKYYSVVPREIGFWIEGQEKAVVFDLKDEYDIRISGPEGVEVIRVRDGKLLSPWMGT